RLPRPKIHRSIVVALTSRIDVHASCDQRFIWLHNGVRKRAACLKLLLMPTEIDQILLECQSIRPTALWPDRPKVLDARHHRILILDDIVDRKHAKPNLAGLQSLRNDEIGRHEWCGEKRHAWRAG